MIDNINKIFTKYGSEKKSCLGSKCNTQNYDIMEDFYV
jgi:hypothetical protein